MKKEASPFLKKSAGGKPPTRKEMKKGGLGGRGVSALLGTPKPVQAEPRIPASRPEPAAPASAWIIGWIPPRSWHPCLRPAGIWA